MIEENEIFFCKKCVFSSKIPNISFDFEGICNYCKIHDEMEKIYPTDNRGKSIVKRLIRKIKRDGKDKEYDCLVGVSGGTDSSYMLYVCVKLGLRPLAVHFDNGWNSPIAVSNIKLLLKKLNVDLFTYVVDWEEFKNLQIAFLKSSTSDAEIPTDVGIHGCLLRTASKFGIKYIMNGHSFRNESLMPLGWTYMDGQYIKSVNKRYNNTKLLSFPNVTMADFLYYSFLEGTKTVPILNYIKYDKTKAIKVLEKKLGWTYSGGHHHESYYTEFFQSFYLPHKFNIDKRITEMAGYVRTNQVSRSVALEELTSTSYEYKQELINYTLTKLDLSKEEFENILTSPIRTFHDYETYFPLIEIFKKPIKFLATAGLLPYVLYQKFFSEA